MFPMRRSFCLFFFSLTTLVAAEKTASKPEPAKPAEKPSESLWDYHPVHLGGNAIFIGKANVKVREDGVFRENGHLTFNKENAFLYMLLPVSRSSYFFPRVEWNTFHLNWNHNPKFTQDRFNYLQFGLTFYSTGIDKWRWILRFDYNVAASELSNPGPYSLYNGLVWGSYEVHRKWHYHVGALGYRGMEGQAYYPIIGIDFAPNKIWLFQAIFPIDYSVQYKIDKYFRLSLKVRPLKERFRTGKHEVQPRSVFSYSSVGGELNLHFEIERRFEFEIYGGYNFGGNFYIKDQKGHNALYTHTEGAPYIGANLNYAF